MIALIVGFPIILTSSCRNFIESELPPTQINVEQVFETTSTAEGALSSLYAELQYYSLISGGNLGMGALLGTYTDDLDCYIVSSQNGTLDIFHNQLISSNSTTYMAWQQAYKEIYSANAIIQGVKGSSGIPQADKNRMHGEALFVRSLLYFYLSQLYGAVPYTTTTDYTVNRSLQKTETSTLLVKIQEDLETAVSLLEDTYRDPNRVYPNRKAAEMMLAIVLMQQKKWQQAEQQLKIIINSPLYLWEPDVTKTFKRSGKHILWQIKPLKTNNPTEEANVYNFTTAVPNTFALSSNLATAFDNTDLRKQNWIKEIIINQNTFYRCDKYRNSTNNPDEYSIIFRLEEAHLLLAEALAQQNKFTESLPYINKIRQKAGLLLYNFTTKEDLLMEIINQNRKEFFAERGNRFITLKRNEMLNILSIVKPNWQPNHAVWPLPLSELILNPNLNPQNIGY